MDYRVISIGTLSSHELWVEKGNVRTPHATTTLIRTGDRVILVDPGLPPQIIAARLTERTGLLPSDVTDVFLTNYKPAHRSGLVAFDNAKWFIAEAEKEAAMGSLVELAGRPDLGSTARQVVEQEISLLRKCDIAPDRIAPQVDIFPVPGYTRGTCGLLLSLFNQTVLVAGDSVATVEHLEQGRVLRGAEDTALAKESFLEAIEIADIIIPGHDNLTVNQTKRPV